MIHVDPSKPFILKMDAFDFVIHVIFLQLGEYNIFILLAFVFVSIILQRLSM
jgi:hypothetical protein